jgi:hypothetical protein
VLSRASTSRRRCSIEPPPSQKRGILINCTHMVRSGIYFDPPPGPCALLQLEAAAADGFSTTVFHVQKQQHDRRWLSPRRPHRSSHVLYAARRSRVKPAMSDGVARRVRTQLYRLPQYVQLRGGLLGSATCRRRQRPSSSATALVRTPPAVKRAAHVRPRRRRCLGTAPLCRRRVPSTRACRRDEERASSQVALARRRLWSPLFFCRTIMEPAAVACLATDRALDDGQLFFKSVPPLSLEKCGFVGALLSYFISPPTTSLLSSILFLVMLLLSLNNYLVQY